MSNLNIRSDAGEMCPPMVDPEKHKRRICLMLYLNQGWKRIECSRMHLRLHNLPDASTVGRMLYTLMEYVMYFVEGENNTWRERDANSNNTVVFDGTAYEDCASGFAIVTNVPDEVIDEIMARQIVEQLPLTTVDDPLPGWN